MPWSCPGLHNCPAARGEERFPGRMKDEAYSKGGVFWPHMVGNRLPARPPFFSCAPFRHRLSCPLPRLVLPCPTLPYLALRCTTDGEEKRNRRLGEGQVFRERWLRWLGHSGGRVAAQLLLRPFPSRPSPPALSAPFALCPTLSRGVRLPEREKASAGRGTIFADKGICRRGPREGEERAHLSPSSGEPLSLRKGPCQGT